MKETILLAAMAIASVNTQAQKLFTLEELNFGGKNYKDNVPASLKAHWNGNDLIERDGENYFKYVHQTGCCTDEQGAGRDGCEDC